MANPLNWILIVAGAIMILIEVVLGAVAGFDFLLLGSAVLLGGLLGVVTGNGLVGLAAAGVLSLLYVLLGRKKIRSRLRRPSIPSNTDALMNRIAIVIEPIGADHPGRVRSEGEEWLARLADESVGEIESGRRVRVSRIDGVTVYVAPAGAGDSTGGVSP
ncbi:MAG: NfeD family protein [Candidatus Eisenbacteria bacterium]|nr:NfeD family protein [Candidatus Eisenbacteria bacterium]